VKLNYKWVVSDNSSRHSVGRTEENLKTIIGVSDMSQRMRQPAKLTSALSLCVTAHCYSAGKKYNDEQCTGNGVARSCRGLF
jgi:hypothetical protein